MKNARWVRLADDLTRGITNGDYPLNSYLPTEMELCEKYNPSLADSGKQKALNSLIISEFRAFLNYCLVYMLEHVLNQLRNCLLCCKSYS